MQPRTCTLETLSSSPCCELLRCSGCGTVHIHFDSVSFRIGWERFVEMTDTLNRALAQSEITPTSLPLARSGLN